MLCLPRRFGSTSVAVTFLKDAYYSQINAGIWHELGLDYTLGNQPPLRYLSLIDLLKAHLWPKNDQECNNKCSLFMLRAYRIEKTGQL